MKSKCISILCIILFMVCSSFSQSAAPSQSAETLLNENETIELAPLNPDFIAWRDKQRDRQLGLVSEEGTPSGIIPSPFDDSYLHREKSLIELYAELPSQYDLRSFGYVTPVKNQGACGACWAFATYSSLESCLLKKYDETWDLSENHLKNYYGFDGPGCDGGNWKMSTAYLTRWSGPVSEEDDPFHDWDDYPSPGGQILKNVVSVLAFYTEEDIKNAVMTYGALLTSMHWDRDFYNSSSQTYYYNGIENVNHGVAIIGWDDNKYVPGSPQRGAWLVKNSWGTLAEQAPYIFVSYNDTKAIDFGVAFCDAEPTSSYLNNYQYDELGFVSAVGTGTSNTCWGANIFTANADEHLAAVGFYALSENMTYEITVYDTINRVGDSVFFTNQLTSKTSTVRRFGYYTVNLPSTVALNQGDDFAMVIKFTTPDTMHPVPIERPLEGISSAARANAGEGYLSTNGQLFQDITTQNGLGEASICVKGLTIEPEPESTETPIVGTWDLYYSWDDANSDSTVITFSSDGTFTTINGSGGTWYQSDDFIEWTYASGTVYSGSLSSSTTMSGTMVSFGGLTGTWHAIKQSQSTETLIVGTWYLYFSWIGANSDSTVITFSSDGTFTTNDDFEGTWYQSGDFVEWTYANGTVYSGSLSSPTAMSGTMVSFGGVRGTWYAYR